MNNIDPDCDLLIGEFGHAFAQANEGCAMSTIQMSKDERGEYAHCLGYEVFSSGPKVMKSTPGIVCADAAFRLALSSAFQSIPTWQKLKLSPTALPVCAKLGLCDEDFAEVGDKLTKELARESIFYVLLALFYQVGIKQLAREHLDQFKAGERVTFVGEYLRDAISDGYSVVSQLATVVPRIIDDEHSLQQMAKDLDGGVMLANARKAAKAIAK